MSEKETPLMKQYNVFKTKYPGAILLFRVGDFYETFGEDAIKASRILDIVLTKRANGGSYIELAGFPHHSLDNYLPKLVRAGERVAICDQIEDPKFAKGIVKRGVTELVTPGVSMNDNVLESRKNNYLAAVTENNELFGISFLDISTGEFLAAQGSKEYILKLLQGYSPSEVIFNKSQKAFWGEILGEDYSTYLIEEWVYKIDFAYEKLTRHFETTSLKGFGIEHLTEGIVAAGAVLHYLALTEHHETAHINQIGRIEEEKYVWLDKFTIRNLELIYPQHEGGVPLIQILDKTVTPMGARLLRKWVVLPLKTLEPIQERLSMVRFFKENTDLKDKITKNLHQIGDLERLISKVSVGRINPREMQKLRLSLENLIPIKELLQQLDFEPLAKIADQLNPCEFLLKKISAELQDEPPIAAHLGNVIKDGVHTELDELRILSKEGKSFLEKIVQKEILNTAIPSLKIDYNKVFGYYLEVRNMHQNKVPKEWIRKQTLSNAERYITEELKIYEEKILNAESKIGDIEIEMFRKLVVAALDYVLPVQLNARLVAQLDCLLSFAEVAEENDYSFPQINDSQTLTIRNGRHPVIERQLPVGEKYVPNDIFLDDQSQQILIITGPNMAGKSAILRQTALIVLLAQMGCLVPAETAEIGLVDKIFTRVGASDNLSKGESTFMVEMTETASILNNLSERSLVLMDEIGRGTSTYDGISIAWAIVEHLHNHRKFRPKTLFATHYHELNQLADDFERIKNYNVAVKEINNKVIFLRKLQAGGSEHSFGIHVAQMAGLPQGIVLRANEIMHELEKEKTKEKTQQRLKEVPKNQYQAILFSPTDPHYQKVKELVGKIDINTLSPVEALLKLNEVKILMEGK